MVVWWVGQTMETISSKHWAHPCRRCRFVGNYDPRIADLFDPELWRWLDVSFNFNNINAPSLGLDFRTFPLTTK